MKEEKAIALIHKYNRAELSPEQEVRLNEWYLINAAESKDELSHAQIKKIVDSMRPKLPLQEPVRKIVFWPRIAAAAAILIIIAVGLFYDNQQSVSEHRTANVYRNDIAPGSNKAYLTLADGSKITLDDAANTELATQAGIKITKTKEGQLRYKMAEGNLTSAQKTVNNTISTPKGGQYQVILADGTQVWLNAGSSLTYPSAFTHVKERIVTLTGEGYFEVAKDKRHPFLVKTKQQTIEVLGTHFNINDYPEEQSAKTTLLEGLVRIYTKDTPGQRETGQILQPGQQAILKRGGLEVKAANIEEAIAWKNGYFRFNDESIQSVMRKLSRWYDIEVHYQGMRSNESFNGKISRYNKISEVLNALESTKAIHFKVEGRRVTVIK